MGHRKSINGTSLDHRSSINGILPAHRISHQRFQFPEAKPFVIYILAIKELHIRERQVEKYVTGIPT